MKKVIQLLSRLRRMNVKLHAVGDRLRFDGPKQVLSPELIEELRANKADLLKFLKQANAGATKPITPRDPELADLPLSFAQQRLWFLNQLEPDSAAYNVPTALRLTGRLDLPCLERCLNEIVARHESLRTTFTATDGQPNQHIAEPRARTLPTLDLSPLPEAMHEDRVRLLAERESQHLFDLERGPLLRTHLIRLEPEAHVFLFTMHHIISDGWSSGVIIRELGSLYGAAMHGREAGLDPLPIQYADFACWQRQWLNEDILEDQRNYWRHQLSGGAELIALPYDRLHPPIQSYKGAKQDFAVDRQTARALKMLAQSTGSTLFTVLAGAFFTMLCRYSGQEDLTIGTPVANRNRKELEPLIGFFVNTLALRVSLSGNPAFSELLARLREVVMDAFLYQDLPFEHVVEAIKPERNLSISPFFQIMFAHQNIAPEDLELPGLTLSPLRLGHVTAKFDLILVMTERQNEIHGAFEYNVATLDPATMARMAGHLGELLSGIAADPQTPIFGLPFLTERERRHLLDLAEERDTQAEPESPIRLFSSWADRQPDRLALIWKNRAITYGCLWAKALQIAEIPGVADTGGERTLAVLTDRPDLMVAAWLAIWRSGGTILPLEREDGAERIADILTDSGADILLTEASMSSEYSEFEGRIGFLAPDPAPPAVPGREPPDAENSSNRAFLFYPSDAKPKILGFGRSRAAVLHECRWYRDWCGMDPDSLVLQLFPMSSGSAVRNTLAPLSAGAGVLLLPGGGSREAEVLDRIRDHRVQVVNGLPHLLNPMLALAERLDFQPLATLRHLVFSGAPAKLGWLGKWLKKPSRVRIANIYELEAMGGAVLCEALPSRVPVENRFALGGPIPGARAHVVDSALNPVPLGAAGELLVGVPELDHGTDAQTATQRRILADPRFANRRVYRTLDLAKRLADGRIKFLGNLHEPATLKGYRIDLREIEAALAEHESVADAVTRVREDLDEPSLVAYVARAPSAALLTEHRQIEALGQFLRQRLPSYMQPHRIVILDRLPLTAEGKLNPRALPKPSIRSKVQTHVPPRTASEARLAAIWAKVLKRDEIGINDNFFALGGSSLLATQIVSRIKEAFVIELPLRELFLSPTVAGLSAKVDGLRQKTGGARIPDPAPVERDRPLPLSYAQQRLWFLDQMGSGAGVYTISGGLRLKGRLATVFLERSFRDIVDRHESLRTTFTTHEEEPVQVIHPEPAVALPLIDLSGTASRTRPSLQRSLIGHGIALPFDLERGPLLRSFLFRIEPEEYILLVTMHHIVSDGWSIGILVRELAAFYGFHARQSTIALPKLEIQYADFAWWQGAYLEPLFREELSYWVPQLTGAPTLHIPSDRPRPRLPTYRGKAVQIRVGRAIAKKLNRLARDMDATLFMVLESAFATLLARYSGQTDLCVGMPNANRNHRSIEPLIGFFVNTLVLRHQLHGDPSFKEMVVRSRDVTLEAFSRQDIPFERVVEAVHPERAVNRSPLFQVSFVLQNTPMETLTLPGLRLIPLETEHSSAKFDLTLSISETEAGLFGGLEYSTDLFEEPRARAMVEDFQSILAAVGDAPECRLSELPLPGAPRNAGLAEEPAGSAPKRELDRTPARSQTEVRVHAIWREVLGRENIGIHANFFDLGGYSLLGIKIVSRIRNRLNIDLPLRDLFLYPTLAGLCARLDEIADRAGDPEEVPDPVPIPRDRPPALSFAQNRLWFLDKLQGPNPAYNIALALELRGFLDGAHLERAFSEIIHRHEVLRTNFVSIENKPYQRIHPAAPAVLPFIDLTGMSEPDAAFTAKRLAGLEGGHRFDLERESLFRVILLHLGERGRVLLVNMHHIVSDGWSLEVLLQELSALYSGQHRRPATALPPLAIQYADFAHWQKAYLQGRRLEKQLAYWRTKLADAPSLRLSLDGPRPPIQTHRGSQVGFRIEAETAGALRKAGQDAGATQFMTLEAAYAFLLAYYSGQQDICVGTPVANRTVRETEPLIGFFVNTVVLRHDTGGDPEFWDFLESARQVLLEAFANQDVPFEYLVDTLKPQRRLDTTPLFQTVFVLQTGQGTEARLAGTTMTLFQTERTSAKFDLTMSLVETRHGLVGSLEYNTDLFLEPTVREMVEHFQLILREIAAQPHVRLSEMSLPKRSHLPETEAGKREPERTAAVESRARTATEEEVAAIWARLLALETVPLHANFFDLGGHSLMGTQMMSMLRETFATEIPLRDLFIHPTVAGLSEHIDVLKSETRSPAAGPPIEPEPRDQPPPLSFAQQRLWFLFQLEGANPAYNIPTGLRLRGKLCFGALVRAIAEIERRHEALRTTFNLYRDEPAQTIHPEPRVPVPFLDLERLADRESVMGGLIRVTAAFPFDLRLGPLFRAAILRMSPEDHVLALNMHHIISDGWSAGVFIRELSILYRAFLMGEPNPLDPLPIQYADFAIWQRRYLTGERYERHIAYWRRQLEAAPALLTLPTDRPRPRMQTYRGAMKSFDIDGPTTQALYELSKAYSCTLFMTLEAIFALLLSRHSGQEDILLGSPIANRTRRETEKLIGFFVNTLVLRNDLSGNPSFAELISRVKRMALDAYEHQDVPFERVVEAVQPERSLSHSPLFQVMIMLQNTPPIELALPGLKLSGFEGEIAVEKFDMTLTLAERNRGISGAVSYNRDLFDTPTITRLIDHFRTLVTEVAQRPETPLSSISLLDPAELRLLTEKWIGPVHEYDSGKGVLQLFEKQAARFPDAEALVSETATGEDRKWTYRQVDDRARALARLLRARGAGPSSLIGICLDRGADLVAALLAVFKAGGAYLPLDATHPRARLAYILEDSGASILLTEQAFAPRFREGKATLLNVEESAPTGRSRKFLGSEHLPDGLAYTIYTSGSTGRPKGVAIGHRSLVNFLHAMRQYLALGQRDTLVAVTTISFDIAGLELFLPLIQGARIILAGRETAADSFRLSALLRRYEPGFMQATPATWQALLTGGWKGSPGFRALCGGEAFPAELALALLDRGFRVFNLYGPTETTIWSSLDEVEKSEIERQRAVPIGRPIHNTQVFLMDRNLQPVPVGVTGQLLIGGDGLARGYFGRPGLTASGFIPNPLAAAPGSRLYQTGDLARFLSNGKLLYSGRDDHQIKLRGFRIELREIEAVLAEHPGVAQAVVTVRPEPGGPRLAGYVTPRGKTPKDGTASAQSEPLADDLKGFLRRKLPEYMIPASVTVLAELPLTPNGKVDRKGLPAPVFGEGLNDSPPRNATEAKLAELWQEVLGHERVGIHASFFELGGHSLLATRIVARIRDHFAVEIPLREFFSAPTIAAVGRRIEALPLEKGRASQPLQAVPRDQPLPLSHAQQRMWFLDKLEPGNAAYHMPVSLDFEGHFDISALDRCIAQIVARHENLRVSFPAVEGKPTLSFELKRAIEPRLIDLSGLEPGFRSRVGSELGMRDIRYPFDLEGGPLVRVTLLRLTGDRHLFLTTMHHIISDAWSLGVLVEETVALYKAFADRSQPNLPPLPIQYADYAYWQRTYLQGEVMERQRDYWATQLRGAPPLLELPTDRPRPRVQTYRGDQVGLRIGAETGAGLAELGRGSGTTIFMVLHAVFANLLARYSGQDDIRIGVPVANRARSELEPLIGLFVNTLVLRTDLSDDPRFSDFLRRVQAVALDAFANQDVPFEQIVDAFQPQRNLSFSPLFQVMFVLQNAPMRPLRLPGLTIRPTGSGAPASKFDLTLNVNESVQGIRADFIFNADLFDRTTIERLANRLRNLLEAAAENPERRLSSMPLEGSAERHRLISDWNGPGSDFPATQCIHELFEARAARHPDRESLALGTRTLTYGPLNERANRVAAELLELGIGTETPVGICMDRSVEMIVGLLATLKTGGYYIPMDPAYPAERVRYMMEDARIRVLLTTGSSADRSPGAGAATVVLDREGTRFSRHSGRNPGRKAEFGHVAYTIYTSGSTGRPKGVMIEHRAIFNYFAALRERLHLEEGWAYAMVTTIAADLGLTVLYPALCHGGLLHVLPSDLLINPEKFAEYFEAHGIDCLKIVPSHLAALLSAKNPAAVLPRRLLILGGEASQRKWIATLRELAPGCTIYNHYGPTEATVGTLTYRLATGSPLPEMASLPLDRPLANTRAYVVDRRLHPTPAGVPGELCLAGRGLARGYFGKPDLTAERFAPNPFSALTGDPVSGRLYKTGDRVRFRECDEAPGFLLEFLGRLDHQIKLRGFRIELGEIEHCLRQLDGVAEAVVLVGRDQLGQQNLIAYLVPKPGCRIQREAPRRFLSQRLPSYMIPAAFLVLDKLPLTPNGKLAVHELPKLGKAERPESKEFVAPRNEMEAEIAAIWCELLRLDEVGVHDNFFELGGHSLLVTQILSRINEHFAVEISVRYLFEEPTIASIAEYVESVRWVSEGSGVTGLAAAAAGQEAGEI